LQSFVLHLKQWWLLLLLNVVLIGVHPFAILPLEEFLLWKIWRKLHLQGRRKRHWLLKLEQWVIPKSGFTLGLIELMWPSPK